MRYTKALGLVLFVTAILSVLVPQTAASCPVCYGAADSPLIDGMNAAILVLLGITGCVFAGIGSFFAVMRKRSKILHDHSPGKTSVDEKGILQ